MSGLWFPAAIAVAALGLTYLFCLRPMRRGQCMTALPQRREQPLTSRSPELDQALVQAGHELARLREEARRGPPTPAAGASPHARLRLPEEERR